MRPQLWENVKFCLIKVLKKKWKLPVIQILALVWQQSTILLFSSASSRGRLLPQQRLRQDVGGTLTLYFDRREPINALLNKTVSNESSVSYVTRVNFRFKLFRLAVFLSIRMHGTVRRLFFYPSLKLLYNALCRHDVSRRAVGRTPGRASRVRS